MSQMDAAQDFEAFVERIEPALRRALSGHLAPDDVADAEAEAFAYAWQHRERVLAMENPGGYLYRVAQSRSRRRKQGFLPWPSDAHVPEIEPGLPTALAALSPMQQRAVWLVHGCGWSYAETAAALDISASTVGSHVTRALERLREQLGVVEHG